MPAELGRGRPHRPGAREALLLVASLVLATATAEVVMRRAAWGQFRPSETPGLLYDCAPGADCNSLGLREREVAPYPAPGVFRIFVAGDSLTWGDPENPKASIPAFLEQALNAAPPRGWSRVEVLNGGIIGYDIFQVYAELAHKAPAYHPHAVIYDYFLNDFVPTSMLYGFALPYNRGSVAPRWEATAVHRWLLGRSVLYQSLWAAILVRVAARPPSMTDYFDLRERGFGYLQAIRRLAADHRWLLAVAVIPYEIAYRPGGCRSADKAYCDQNDPIADDAVAMCSALAIDSVDLRPVYADATRRGTSLVRKDHPEDILHPNPTGYRLVAERIAGFVREKWYSEIER